MPQSKIEPREVLQYLRDEDLPLLTSRMVAETFDVSDQTARNKLSRLVDEGQLTRVDLGARQSVWLEPDYQSASEVADALRESFDLAELHGEHLVDFAEEPYCILPKEDNEAYVVVPRFVPFHVGWLDRQTDAYNVFVVNKYVDWIDEVPEEIREQVGIGGEWNDPVVADGELQIDPGERGAAWEQFSTDRHQDAIPPDGVLEDMDWERLRGLASRRGVLGQGMTREDVEGALAEERDDGRIPLKDSREFDVIAQLVEDGNLPFEPQPIDESRLRKEPADIDLRDYQRRAWNQYVETGMIGVYWPPGAGKTFISLYAGERLPGEKLVVVPNNTLKEQWQDRIADMCAHADEWRVETYQYLTHGDNIREFEEDGPALTIFDESHHLPANTFATLSTIDTETRIGLSASPYREDGRTEYIFALTGYPVGLKWQELVALGAVDTPDADLYLYSTERQKVADVQAIVDEYPGKILVLCDSLDRGSELADELGVPFVSGETTDRMETFREHRVVIGSRVADEGLSLDQLDVVLEHDFHGGSRRQEAQRYGRVMHGDDGEGKHIIQMTDAEYDRYSSRLMALEEQGINIVPQRRE
jgi:DNA excision repair protein ERCC-3